MTHDTWYKDQLTNYFEGKLEKYQVFDLGPSANLGLRFVPVMKTVMIQAIVRKALDKHGLPKELLFDLCALLKGPVRVFRAKECEKTNVIQLPAAHEGNPLLVAAERMVHEAHGPVHFIKSVHCRPFAQLKRWIDLGLLRYSTFKEDQIST